MNCEMICVLVPRAAWQSGHDSQLGVLKMRIMAGVGRLRATILTLLASFLLSGSSEKFPKEASTLDSSLHYYETLHSSQLSHTLTTSPHNPRLHKRQVNFRTLGRDFQLHLHPYRRIFSPDFAAYTVDAYGQRSKVDVDLDEYYYGYVDGELQSKVIAHVSKDGVLSGTINSESGMYYIEPSDLYLPKSQSVHMIAYQDIHVKHPFNVSKVDYVTGPVADDSLGQSPDEVNEYHYQGSDKSGTSSRPSHVRMRRQFPGDLNGDSCRMILVSDYLYFQTFGRSVGAVVRILITIVSSVDLEIYRPTEWIVNVDNDVVTGIGLEIGQLLIHEVPSELPKAQSPTTFYNHEDLSGADANQLLGEFNFGPWGGFCLAHLFTYRSFSSGLLGLANIATPRESRTGGICSRTLRDSSGFNIIYNTGVSTQRSGDDVLPFREIQLVIAHEIGHGWGSFHDTGGQYLMNEFAQDGSRSSHSRFSEDSRRSIGVVLRAKGDCFGARSSFCGDYLTGGDDEECDEGPNGGQCCTNDCKLKEDFECSDSNSVCCSGCRIVTDNRVCRAAGLSFTCEDNTRCDDVSPECPNERPQAEEGTSCIGGECRLVNGTIQCLSLCVINNMLDCMCEDEDECVLCCRQDEDNSCQRFTRQGSENETESLYLSNGIRCSEGACRDGECVQEGTDVVTKVFEIISDLDINGIIQFMEENIVGFVLIFTTIVWVPVGLLIHCCVDQRVWRKFRDHEKEYLDWFKKRVLEKTPLVEHEAPRDPEVAAPPPTESLPRDVGPQPHRVPREPVDDTPLPPGFSREHTATAW